MRRRAGAGLSVEFDGVTAREGAAGAAGGCEGGAESTGGMQPFSASLFKRRLPGVFILIIASVGRSRGIGGKFSHPNSLCRWLPVGGLAPLRPRESNTWAQSLSTK